MKKTRKPNAQKSEPANVRKPDGKAQSNNALLIAKAEFDRLIEEAKRHGGPPGEAETKLWLALATEVQIHWDGMSSSFFDSLTPGQYALVCTAELYRTTKQDDFVSFVGYTPGKSLGSYLVICHLVDPAVVGLFSDAARSVQWFC
jgi:hypothetical protein